MGKKYVLRQKGRRMKNLIYFLLVMYGAIGSSKQGEKRLKLSQDLLPHTIMFNVLSLLYYFIHKLNIGIVFENIIVSIIIYVIIPGALIEYISSRHLKNKYNDYTYFDNISKMCPRFLLICFAIIIYIGSPMIFIFSCKYLPR